LGSTRVTTDSAGAVRSRDDYLPFGEEIGTVGRSGIAGYSSSTDIHQKFTSKERDVESMLDYFLARYYASSQGRFASVDPLNDGPKQPDPQTLNGYEYCRNNPIKYVDADGQKIRITDANGNYEDISDDQASQTIFNKKWIRSLGYWVQDQKVFDEHGNVIGSYRRISYDDWSDFQNRAIFGVVARADAMNQAIAAFGVGTIAAGATGGVGLYGLTSTGVVGSLTTLGVASGPGALTAVGSTDAAVLSLAIDDGASATGSFEENVGALSRALRQLRPGNQVNKIGELDGKPIFGSLITRGGIASRNGITFVVKVLPEGVKILGPLAK
ncbi:MAG TPA: RHS repeat-associated core domain-containing protein, partial [Blastocatellia bacterium]|nr:RHS repeat-associated core domain-containing protein [Blastocatellia bacterium]